MARDAYKFCIPVLIISLLFVISGHSIPALICFILAAFICYFFRNPKRTIPQGKNLVVSPADGKVVKILQLPGWYENDQHLSQHIQRAREPFSDFRPAGAARIQTRQVQGGVR